MGGGAMGDGSGPAMGPTLGKEVVETLREEIAKLKKDCYTYWLKMREAQMALDAHHLQQAANQIAYEKTLQTLLTAMVQMADQTTLGESLLEMARQTIAEAGLAVPSCLLSEEVAPPPER